MSNKPNTKSWWLYESLFNRMIRRKTFYFKPINDQTPGFAYQTRRKGLVARPFKDLV